MSFTLFLYIAVNVFQEFDDKVSLMGKEFEELLKVKMEEYAKVGTYMHALSTISIFNCDNLLCAFRLT